MSRGVVPVGGQEVRRTSSRSPFNGSPTPGLVDRFTRGLSPTEPAAATFIPAPLRVTSTTRRFDQMAGELKA